MPVITVEPGELKLGTCDACGAQTGRQIGFTYADGDANAVYYLDWCEGSHSERIAYLTVAAGEWGDGTSGADRVAVGIEIRAEGMRLAEAPVIDRPDFLGRFVPRDEAIALGGIDSLWHLADHIVLDDVAAVRVMEWLRGGRATALESG